MVNHHNSTLINDKFNLVSYFNNPVSQRQKQYEAVRAIVIDKQAVETGVP